MASLLVDPVTGKKVHPGGVNGAGKFGFQDGEIKHSYCDSAVIVM